jgi:CubicO group peptidase (beta-lactamase class C family)
MTTWSRRLQRVSIVVLLTLAIHPAGGAQAPGEAREPLPAAAPASVGFSEERLMRLDARMKRFVDEGQHAGIVMLLARKGRVVAWRAWGQRDVTRQLPMEKDTIVRIYSMSKIITSVAVMALVEEGRIKLTDPVTKYLPALKEVKVF